MFGTHNLLAFLFASFLVWITPGVDTMYIITRSITQGRPAGFLSVLGISSGILIHTIFAAFGLSAILAASAWAFTAIKFAGAVYLIYLGIQSLLKKTGSIAAPEMKAMSRWQIYQQGMITNVLNPKVAIFFLAFLPQFVDSESAFGALSFLFLGILFVTGGTLWCLTIALFASTVTKAIRENTKTTTWLERISGGIYIALGLNLLHNKLQPAS